MMDHRAAEAASTESEDRYRAPLRQLSDGVYILDLRTNRIIQADDWFLLLPYYPTGDICALPLHNTLLFDTDIINDHILGMSPNAPVSGLGR